MKGVQGTGETSSTSEHEICKKNSIIVVIFALLDPHSQCGPDPADQNQCGPELRIRIRDPGVPFYPWIRGCLFDPWIREPGWVKSQDPDAGSGSVINNPDHISLELRNNFFWVKILKFFDADPGYTSRIRNIVKNLFFIDFPVPFSGQCRSSWS